MTSHKTKFAYVESEKEIKQFQFDEKSVTAYLKQFFVQASFCDSNKIVTKLGFTFIITVMLSTANKTILLCDSADCKIRKQFYYPLQI